MLLSVSALLWLQSPAWSPPSPQYAPGAYLGRAHRGPSPRVGGRWGQQVRLCYHKEGLYQDRPPLCPFRLLPLLIYSGSAIAFLKVQGPRTKNIENVILLQP